MLGIISYFLTATAVVLCIPTAVLLIEVIASVACRPRENAPARRFEYSPVAVLVPAHDESVALLPTITDVKAQLRIGDRLVVVADNCSDDTASVAAAAHAEVLERR